MTNPFRWGRFCEIRDAGLIHNGGVAVCAGSGFELTRKVLAPDEGEGFLEYLHTRHLRVVVADMMFGDDRTYEVFDGDLIRLHFGLDVSIGLTPGTPTSPVAPPTGNFTVEAIPKNRRQTFVTICCNPRIVKRFADSSVEIGQVLMRRSWNFGARAHARPNSSLMAAAQDIFTRQTRIGLRAAYLVAKAQELIALAMDDALGQPAQALQAPALTNRDLAAVKTAKRIIDEESGAFPTVRALGLRVGVNRNKLNAGFKHLFGSDVSTFIQERRMDEALRLLVSTDMPIGHIAADLGYEHQCNFSTRFRSRYGCSPRAFRARMRLGRSAALSSVDGPCAARSDFS